MHIVFAGDYTLRIFYGDQLLQRCPIIGTVEKLPPPPVPIEPPCPPVQPTPPPVQPVIIVEEVVIPCPKPPQPPAPAPAPPLPRGNAQNVQVIGPGLSDARVNEEAEFLLDASAAGPGKCLV